MNEFHLVCYYDSEQKLQIGNRLWYSDRHRATLTWLLVRSDVITWCFRATYLFSCRGSSYLLRSSWNTSRSGRPDIFYSRPTNWTPASGLSPSEKALKPQLPRLRKSRQLWSHLTPITFVILRNCRKPAIWHRHQSTTQQGPYLTWESSFTGTWSSFFGDTFRPSFL